MNKYMCCFCGDSIEGKITALLAVTSRNDDDNEENQQSQQLFCHLNCLRQAIKNPAYLYVEE